MGELIEDVIAWCNLCCGAVPVDLACDDCRFERRLIQEIADLRAKLEQAVCKIHQPKVGPATCCHMGDTIVFWDQKYCEAVNEDEQRIDQAEARARLMADVVEASRKEHTWLSKGRVRHNACATCNALDALDAALTPVNPPSPGEHDAT